MDLSEDRLRDDDDDDDDDDNDGNIPVQWNPIITQMKSLECYGNYTLYSVSKQWHCYWIILKSVARIRRHLSLSTLYFTQRR